MKKTLFAFIAFVFIFTGCNAESNGNDNNNLDDFQNNDEIEEVIPQNEEETLKTGENIEVEWTEEFFPTAFPKLSDKFDSFYKEDNAFIARVKTLEYDKYIEYVKLLNSIYKGSDEYYLTPKNSVYRFCIQNKNDDTKLDYYWIVYSENTDNDCYIVYTADEYYKTEAPKMLKDYMLYVSDNGEEEEGGKVIISNNADAITITYTDPRNINSDVNAKIKEHDGSGLKYVFRNGINKNFPNQDSTIIEKRDEKGNEIISFVDFEQEITTQIPLNMVPNDRQKVNFSGYIIAAYSFKEDLISLPVYMPYSKVHVISYGMSYKQSELFGE